MLTGTRDRLAAGTCTVGQAQVIAQVTAYCTDQVARAVETRLGDAIGRLNTSDLRRRALRCVLRVEAELDAETTRSRRKAATEDRAVWHRALPDGMAQVGATLSGEQATRWLAAFGVLSQQEQAAERAAGGTRTLAQLQADLFADLPGLVLHGPQADGEAVAPDPDPEPGPEPEPGGRCPRSWRWQRTRTPHALAGRCCSDQVRVIVHIPVLTALGLNDEPGELDGYGPISATDARLLLPGAHLQRLLVNETTGLPEHFDPVVHPPPADLPTGLRDLIHPDEVPHRVDPGHDPSEQTRRFVMIRDRRCDGPGCSQPASRSDLDHHIPWPDGPTSTDNLKVRSRRCHRAKHAGYTVTWHPDGSSTWTSPNGRHYHRPAPHEPPDGPRPAL